MTCLKEKIPEKMGKFIRGIREDLDNEAQFFSVGRGLIIICGHFDYWKLIGKRRLRAIF